LPAKDSAISFQPLTHYAGPDIPTAIVRPSIIGSTWKEPYAGWIDNFNGPAGLSLAAGTGVMRVMPGDRDVLADIVPVDSVVSKSMVCWLVRIRLCVCVLPPATYARCSGQLYHHGALVYRSPGARG
jgi:hypothetical protein